MGDNMKRKLWLMGICIGILIFIFAKNIYTQLNQDKGSDKGGPETVLRKGNLMTVSEALRLAGFLGLGEDALWEAAGMTKPADKSEDSFLSFKECRGILDLICSELSINEPEVISKLNFDLKAGEGTQEVLAEEYLNLYESILSVLPKDSVPVKEKALFVIGKPKDSEPDSETTMITDQGTYKYQKVTSYDSLYHQGVLVFTGIGTEGNQTEEAKDNQSTGVEDKQDKQSDGETFVQDNQFLLKNYMDHKIIAMVSGSNLVYVKGVAEEETTLHNVYITSGEGSTVTAFLNDITRDFKTRYKLSKEIKGQIGDVVVENGKITKISIKPDKIGGKVLVANQKYVEIEGYGKVNLDEYYKIYKIYGELSMEVTNSILVGYEATDFVVADGKIVAALIKETIKAKDIRVLIKTDDYAGIYHNEVLLTSDKEFTLKVGDTVKSYKAGQKVTIKPDNKLLKKGRLRFQAKSESGKIELLSVNRASGKPAYRGALEIASTKEGLIIINELPIEEYLYAVIPSEMPSIYGLEALKVQAICARSYAYNQLFANGYSEFGAHVDDSVSYQVYNNIPENEKTILAVKDTYGKVIEYQNTVVSAYYFSTSCGHTASLNEVWGGSSADYLLGKLQTTYEVVNGEAVYASTVSPSGSNLSSEDKFRDFILKAPSDTYDSKFAWYRWNVTISKENLKKSIDKNLASRYNANPDLIQTLVGGKVNDNPKYESKPVNTIGTLKDILVSKREKSGILSAIILVGSDCTVKVQSEYNIRSLLAPLFDKVTRQDDSTISDLSMLPSAFFIMDKSGKSITLHGGGYGHGVGMSQNGVKAMADSGKDYEEIIKHYYTDVEIGFIY
jgi:stage II sporulation protein D